MVAELNIENDKLYLKKPSTVLKVAYPFWVDKSPFSIAVANLQDTQKIYTTAVYKKESLFGFEISEEIHTIYLFFSSGHKDTIQFEDQESFDRACSTLTYAF